MQQKHLLMTTKEFVFHYIFAVLPISLAALILPIYVKLRSVTLDAMTDDFYGSLQFDLHAVARKEALIFISSVAVIFFLVSAYLLYGKIAVKMKSIGLYIICSTIYILFTFISAILSENQEVAFGGLFCNGQGFYSELCYMLLFLLAAYATCFLLNTDIKHGRTYIKGEYFLLLFLALPLLIVFLVNVFIGTVQFLGIDVFSIDFIARYIAGKDYELYNFTSAFEPGRVFGTFYNPNYAGVYGVLMFALFMGLAQSVKKLAIKVTFVVCSLLALMFTLSITSEGALVGLLVIACAYTIIYYRTIKKYWYYFCGIALAGIIAVCVLFQPTVTALTQSVIGMMGTLIEPYDRTEVLLIQDILFEEDGIVFSTVEGSFLVSLEEETDLLCIYQDEALIYEVSYLDASTFSLPNTILSEVSFEIQPISENEIYFLALSNWKFYMNTDGEAHAISAYTGIEIEVAKPSTALNSIDPTLGSNRVYIWSRTIPLLKQYLLVGCGPDNFVFQFPQYDLIGREECEIPATIIYLNAHNSYLQVAINSGGIAFLAYITMLVHYFFSSIRLYTKKKNKEFLDYVGIGIFTAILGASAALFFVDMLIYFAPIFWIIFGVGLPINASRDIS
ncbi:MAG: O-antigen ligase family protein [Lachnospiraceae bacterium]